MNCRLTRISSEADWPAHKPQCELRNSLAVPQTITFKSLHRFSSRFSISFETAIPGLLNLRRNPRNVDNLAVLLIVKPPKTSKASHFVMDDLIVYPMAEFLALLKSTRQDMSAILDMHKIQREEYRRDTDGMGDFATMAIRTGNGHSQDDPYHLLFVPVPISWHVINNASFYDHRPPATRICWGSTLGTQIDSDLPDKHGW